MVCKLYNYYRDRDDVKRANQMYVAAVKYCNKCDIEISYLDNLLAK